MNIISKLVESLPKLKTPVQVSGFVVAVAAAVVIHVSSPGNVPAIIAGGSIGILLVIYGQFFNSLRAFLPKQRAAVFLVSLVCVLAALIALLYLAMVLAKNPDPSASVSLFSGELPPELDADPRYTEPSEKTGHLLIYRTTRGSDGALVVTPFLSHLDLQSKGGPLYPPWISAYFFPVPVFSIVVNNPTKYPLSVTGIELEIRHRIALRTPWIFVSQPYTFLDEPDRYPFHLRFNDFGWNEFADASVSYDIVPIPDDFPGLASDFSIQSNLYIIENIPGSYWDKPFPYQSDAAKYSKDFLGAEVSFRLSIEALKKASGQRTGLLFGTLNYEDVDAETHRLRFLTRVFYRAPGGPGRINPSTPWQSSRKDHLRQFTCLLRTTFRRADKITFLSGYSRTGQLPSSSTFAPGFQTRLTLMQESSS